MEKSVFQRIIDWLQDESISHTVLHHEPVRTSEEAARVRGTSLASGAKALICKVDQQFVLIVLPADLRLDSRSVRNSEKVKSLRFANREEVMQLTGLTPGSIPPFGSLFGLPTWCDRQLAQQTSINFNAGDHSVSISMAYSDFVRIEAPRLGTYASH